jgi:hypothetical protein
MDITAISEATWRGYPAVALVLCGIILLAKGLWFGFAGSRGLLREREALGWMRGFRVAVVGLCLVGIGRCCGCSSPPPASWAKRCWRRA